MQLVRMCEGNSAWAWLSARRRRNVCDVFVLGGTMPHVSTMLWNRKCSSLGILPIHTAQLCGAKVSDVREHSTMVSRRASSCNHAIAHADGSDGWPTCLFASRALTVQKSKPRASKFVSQMSRSQTSWRPSLMHDVFSNIVLHANHVFNTNSMHIMFS